MNADRSELAAVDSHLKHRVRPLMGGRAWASSLSLYELFKFGRSSWWWRLHWALWREFRSLNITDVVSSHGGENPGELSYGETPTIALQTILRMADLSQGASFVDLGMGRGLCTLAAELMGYKAAGLEIVSAYVERAESARERLGLKAQLLNGDMLDEPWPDGELYLLNSTAFPVEFRKKLLLRLQELPTDKLVATYDWSLGEGFEEVKEARLPVTWGTVSCRIFRRL